MTDLIELLPTEEISGACGSMEAALADMVEAWRGSEHSAAEAAPAAVRTALDELEKAAAGLEEVQVGIASYMREL